MRRDIYYTYHEVLYALCERRTGQSMPFGEEWEELGKLRTKLALLMPTIRQETILEIMSDKHALRAQTRNDIYLSMQKAVKADRQMKKPQ